MKYESQYYGVVFLGDSISHHGIKGQRWGVRRFQNEDGSYTAAGKANRKGNWRKEVRERRKERRKAHHQEIAKFQKELKQRRKDRRDAARKETREFYRRTRKQRLAQYGLIAGIVVANALAKKAIQKQSMASLRKSLKNRDPFEGYRIERKSRNSLNMKNMTMDDLRKLDLY